MSFSEDLQTGLIAQAAALVTAATISSNANSDSIDFQKEALEKSLDYQQGALNDTLDELANSRADMIGYLTQGKTESLNYLADARRDNLNYQETALDKIIANNNAAHERAMDKQQQALDFSKYRYKQWEDSFIPLQEDISKYIEELTARGVVTREVNDIQNQLQKANDTIVATLACRGISRSGLEAALLNENTLLADMNKANVRSTAEERVYLRKQNFLALGIHGGTALAQEIYGLDNNMGNLILQNAANISNAIGNNARAVGTILGNNARAASSVISNTANNIGNVISTNSGRVVNTIMTDAARYANLVTATGNNISALTTKEGAVISDYVVGFGNSVASTVSTYGTMELVSKLNSETNKSLKHGFGTVKGWVNGAGEYNPSYDEAAVQQAMADGIG